MPTRLHRDERGVAMIASLAVAFVVLTLATVVVSQSIHSIETSGYERERLLSINAAEAGTNRWYAYLQTTPTVNMSTHAGCDAATGKLTLSEVVQSGPAAAAFNAVATFYAADGTTTMSCATFNDTTFPSFAKIRSTGTINGAPNRTIETYVRLTPNFGGFGAAIMAINGTTITNSFTINGNSGNDGDIYILNGDFRVTNSMTLSGNVYVPNGTAQLENTATVKGNVWANGNVTLQNGATIQGDALSTSGDISGSGTINDDATAGGTVNPAGLSIGGIVTSGVQMPAVPTQTFPQITANTAPWIASGYTLVDLSTASGGTLCAKARDWIKNRWAGSGVTNALIRINTTCTFSNNNNDTFSIPGHLAILSDGGFAFSQQSDWNGTSGTIKNIHFISVYSTTCSGTQKDISVGNNTNFNSFTNVSFYTPCRATMSNTNAFSGQVLSKDVSIGNNFTMTYKPVLVPGITGVTGFKQDISYIHE
jgi:Tfp pilus assembly protein PilX